jgi:hypothetical protein
MVAYPLIPTLTIISVRSDVAREEVRKMHSAEKKQKFNTGVQKIFTTILPSSRH